MSPLAWIAASLHAAHQRLIRNWFRRAQGERLLEFDIFDRFVALWIAFDAWGTSRSGRVTGRGVINWSKTHSPLQVVI